METKWQSLLILIVVMMIIPGHTLAAAKKPTTMAELAFYKGADRQQILEEGAKKERKLTFYTSGILTQAVRPVVDAFEKKYPFIKVEIWRASGGEQISRTVEEFKFGKHLFDAIECTVNMAILQQAGIAQPFNSPNFLQMDEEALTRAPGGGAYAAAFRSSGIGFGYNTNLLKKEQIPRTYRDLIDPQWKGKFPIAGGDTGAKWAICIKRNYGEDLLKLIAKQDFVVHMVSGQAILDLVISGEYPGSPNIFDSHVFGSKKKGAPVAWVPLEPVHVNVGQIALAKYAPNPHAALLFADFELSKESGDIHRGVGYDSFRKDVPPLEQSYKKYFAKDTMDDVKEGNELSNRLFLKK